MTIGGNPLFPVNYKLRDDQVLAVSPVVHVVDRQFKPGVGDNKTENYIHLLAEDTGEKDRPWLGRESSWFCDFARREIPHREARDRELTITRDGPEPRVPGRSQNFSERGLRSWHKSKVTCGSLIQHRLPARQIQEKEQSRIWHSKEIGAVAAATAQVRRLNPVEAAAAQGNNLRPRNKPKPNPADNPTPRRSRRAKKNPRGGVLDSLIQVGVAATGVVLVNELVNTVMPGATGKPIVMLGGGLAISYFAPNSKTGEKINFIGQVIAVGGVVGIITPFVRLAFQGVRQSAQSLIGSGTDEPVGEDFHLPHSPLGEYVDLTGEQLNAYSYGLTPGAIARL